MECFTKDGFLPVAGKILFLGDSITDDGRYITFIETWLELWGPKPAPQLYNLGVSSETVSGLSEPDHPFPRPCLFSRLQKALDTVQPDWVVLCYGINDGIYYPHSQERQRAYELGIRKAVETVHSFGAKAVVMTPPPFDASSFRAKGNSLTPAGAAKYSFMAVYSDYNKVMEAYAQSLLENGQGSDAVIDIHGALAAHTAARRAADPQCEVGDGIHPDQSGHLAMAQAILEGLFGISSQWSTAIFKEDDWQFFNLVNHRSKLLHSYYKELVGHENPYQDEFLAGEALKSALSDAGQAILEYQEQNPWLFAFETVWEGYPLQIRHFEGYEVLAAIPKVPAAGRPWAWRTEFFGAFPFADLALLNQGWHVVHITISHRFGGPKAVKVMQRFYEEIRLRLSLSSKMILFGFSRGGLYAQHYAATNPQTVAALYLDAPVVNIGSWPGGLGKGVGSAWDYPRALAAFEIPQAQAYLPIQNAAFLALVNNKLPLLLVAGDSDEVVPWEENGALLEKAYNEAGLPVQVILKPGVGHHPHSLTDPAPIVRFCTEHLCK